MCEWEGPVRKTFRNIYLAVLFTIVLMAISSLVVGTFLDHIISAIELFMFVYVPYLFVITLRLPKVRNHFFSRWDMDKDWVARRIDTAMRRKGVNVVIGYKGDTVIFPLPPMSIVVAPERKKTTVYVGPVTDANPHRVEALKAFVDEALGKRVPVP